MNPYKIMSFRGQVVIMSQRLLQTMSATRKTKNPKSQYYIDTYEKPKMVQYINTISQDLDWKLFAQTMELPAEERASRLSELYDNGILPCLRAAVLSQIQSSKTHSGKGLETKLQTALDKLGIAYGYQVPVKDNKILARRNKGCHVLDFVIPKPVAGESLETYVIISSKTTLRERFLQDAHFKCKEIIFVTHDAGSPVENKIVIERTVQGEESGEIDVLVAKLDRLRVQDD
jgi:hypothetical protein